jgi:hypothetical protein
MKKKSCQPRRAKTGAAAMMVRYHTLTNGHPYAPLGPLKNVQTPDTPTANGSAQADGQALRDKNALAAYKLGEQNCKAGDQACMPR